jgi:G3E family GTPase
MKIKIDIFSGFLGAGKTKLIKKLINENLYRQRAVVIENEFGEVGIDGTFLKKYNIEVKEINAGCICCSVLNDFKNILQEVIYSQEIERIIIEPSGIGKLSEIITIVKKLESENNISLNMIITVVDVTMYEEYIDIFSEFYKDQIINANTIVLSRTQNVDYEKTQSVVSKIRELNEKANIITTPWDNLSGDEIVSIGEKDRRLDIFKAANEKPFEKVKLMYTRKHSEEPTSFDSYGIETLKVFSIENLKSIFSKIKNEELYGRVLRAKGIVQVNENRWVEFDFEPNQFEIRDTQTGYIGHICVIGTNLHKDKLINLFNNTESSRIKIIACEVMKEEILSINTSPDVDFEFVSMDFHLYPKKLGKELQNIIDRSFSYSRVILAFGLCGGASKGLKATNCALTIPRVHDCISIFLSAGEDCVCNFEKEMGTFYLSKGWMISEKSILSDHQRILEKYGPQKAFSVLKRMYEGYKKVLFIQTGCPIENETILQSKQIAKLLCVNYETIQGETAFVKKIVSGPWDNINFINIEPMEFIAEKDFCINVKEKKLI